MKFNHITFSVLITFQMVNLTINICSQIVITGRGTSSISDRLINNLAMEFESNRSVVGRNTKLLYFTDSLGGSEIAITINSSNPVPFAVNIVPMFKEDSSKTYTDSQHLENFPLLATAIVIIYQLPEIKNLTLSLDIVSLVYQGLITTWNHDKIKALNPNTNLPIDEIKVVARKDDSGTTFSLTSALSHFDNSWNEKYGIFSNPQLITSGRNISSRWPNNAITYFAAGGTGLVGIITSIPHTLGYTSLGNAQENNLQYAALVNYGNQPILPTSIDSIHAAINYYSLFLGSSLVYDVANAKVPNAYPLVTYIYFAVDMETHPKISCCTMEETVGLFEWLLSTANKDMLQNYGFFPLPDSLAIRVRSQILQKIKCNNLLVYDNFLESFKPPKMTLQLYHIILIIFGCIMLMTFIVVALFSVRLHKKRKREETKWFIQGGVIKPSFLFESTYSFHNGRTTSTPGGSLIQATSDRMGLRPNIEKQNLKHVLNIVNLDGEDVCLQPLKSFAYPLVWKRATKKLMLKFMQQIIHKNVNRILGVVMYQDYLHLVQDYSNKGTLHYVLQTSKYDLNDNVKYNLAIDVATGVQYLVSQSIFPMSLSSISCYVDGSWTVKIGEWGEKILSITEGLTKVDSGDEIDHASESDFIRLLYKDYELNQINSYKHEIYSFGMLLIEIFSRRLPYHHAVKSKKFTYAQIFEEKFIKYRHVEPDLGYNDLPMKATELINQCCKSISLRPTFTEILITLNKIKQSKKGIVDTMMDIVELHTADLQQKTTDLIDLNNRMEELLHAVLPPQIACKLFLGETVEPEYFDCVTVCFADVVGFTSISAKSEPQDVMAFLNDLWLLFDNLVHQFDAYKIDTIGDAYLVCSGLPQRNDNQHCKQIASLSLSLLAKCENFKIFHLPHEKLMIRVGINSGSVTAGIVGSKMPQYCIFGDTVNVAARMQTTSLPSKIHVSEATYNILQKHYGKCFKLEERGNVNVKGKGIMKTYWLINEMFQHQAI